MMKMFREEKVLTPIAYFNLNNPDYFKSDYWRKEFDWHIRTNVSTLNTFAYAIEKGIKIVIPDNTLKLRNAMRTEREAVIE